MEQDKKKLREDFVISYRSGDWSMAELCEHFGISRPTGYLWINRYEPGSTEWNEDRSRAPHHPARRTPEAVIEMILRAREHYRWRAKKLRWKLERERPEI